MWVALFNSLLSLITELKVVDKCRFANQVVCETGQRQQVDYLTLEPMHSKFVTRNHKSRTQCWRRPVVIRVAQKGFLAAVFGFSRVLSY